MGTPLEKGNALEAAVASIEHHILSTSPSLREKPFLIESKKIVSVDGVRHEIDIFVTIDLGDGYKSVFIFECKNWQEAVGKNEIIVFAEKISVTQAQTGYFVAKSFTKDARSQAALNPRISLLMASELDPAAAPLPFGLHENLISPVHADTVFFVRGADHSKLDTIDLKAVIATLDGAVIDLCQYLNKWAEEAASNDVLSFRSEREPEGVYQHSVKSQRAFMPGELTLDGRDIEKCETAVDYRVILVRAAVVSHFEVESRGRVVSLAPIQIPSGPEMQIKIISR